MKRGKRCTTAGVRCDCGSCDTRVLRTIPGDGLTIRRIECRVCKSRMTTRETRLTGPQPTRNATDIALAIAQLVETAGLAIPASSYVPQVADNVSTDHTNGSKQ